MINFVIVEIKKMNMLEIKTYSQENKPDQNEKEAKMTQEAVLGVVVGRTDDVQLVRTPRPTQPWDKKQN